MLIIGHRGVPSLAPENTLGGFQKASELGVKWVELDVTLLGDATAVVIHDDTLDRCSDRQGALRNLKYTDLLGINNAALYPEWLPEPVPLLSDVLQLLDHLDMGLNLEIKPYDIPHELLIEILSKQIAHYFPNKEKLIVSSFDLELLNRCRSYLPEVKIGLLFDELPEDWLIIAQSLNAFSIHLDWQGMSFSQVQRIKQAGYKVYCWTLNNPSYQPFYESWGVDGIMSDWPQLFDNSDVLSVVRVRGGTEAK